MNEIGRLLFGKDVPAPKTYVLCTGCGNILTSPRSIRWGEGQRCRWKRLGPNRPRRKRGAGQGVPISDVPFAESGGKSYRTRRYINVFFKNEGEKQ